MTCPIHERCPQGSHPSLAPPSFDAKKATPLPPKEGWFQSSYMWTRLLSSHASPYALSLAYPWRLALLLRLSFSPIYLQEERLYGLQLSLFILSMRQRDVEVPEGAQGRRGRGGGREGGRRGGGRSSEAENFEDRAQATGPDVRVADIQTPVIAWLDGEAGGRYWGREGRILWEGKQHREQWDHIVSPPAPPPLPPSPTEARA